ncbi:MAG: hypothetical protein KDM64_15120, partial [Verrucomicrobiae bacterium]|nr:hypothetical protein [Verrucomicrobiae bacterium]
MFFSRVYAGFLFAAALPSAGAADWKVATPDQQAVEEALRLAREAPGPDRLLLPAGTISLSRTVVLTREDEGLTIEAADPTQPCWISGATGLHRISWSRVAGEARPIWAASIPEDWPEPRSLFADGKPLQRARSRGYLPLSVPPDDMPYAFRRAIDGRHLYLPREAIEEIPDFSGAEMRVIPKFPWTMCLLPMTEVDREHLLVRSAVPGLYPMTPPAFGQFPGGTLWIENLPSVLDEPGEWCFDPATRRLSLWMP